MADPRPLVWLRRLSPADPTPDGELARRYHAAGDQAAFELLVRRHAPLVVRICRGVVRDPHAAEDASQAVFLVLARKAGTVAGLTSVAGWLARVAYRTANRARARQRPGRLPPDLPGPCDPAIAAAAAEVSAAVSAAVAGLPARYRDVIALCYFDGLTHAAASARLSVPAGTVAGRMHRARRLLEARLTRRGVTLPAAVAVAVPAGFAVGVGSAAPSPAAVQLASEVLSTMPSLSRRLSLAAGLLAVAAAGLTARPADTPTPAAPAPVRYVIEGTVRDADHAPVAGVTVVNEWSLLKPTTTKQEVVTGPDGRYRLEFGPERWHNSRTGAIGTAAVRAHKPGWYSWARTRHEGALGDQRRVNTGWYSWYWNYPSQFYLWEVPQADRESSKTGYVPLGPDEPVTLDLGLAPAAAVTLRLTDGAGKPLANKLVGLMRERGNAAPGVIASGRTDAAGVWRATEVPCWPCQLALGNQVHNNPRLEYGTIIGAIDFREAAEYTAELTLAAWAADATDVRVRTAKGRKLSP